MTIVAVVDSGVNLRHRDLRPQLWRNPDEIPANGRDDDGNGFIDDVHGIDLITGKALRSDPNGHGSHCAGIVAGTDPAAELMGIRLLDAEGSGSFSAALQAWSYALENGARVISNSWGGPVDPAALEALREAVAIGAERFGAVFVAAAGNDSLNTDRIPFSPSGIEGVLSVGASDAAGRRAPFSNFGAVTVDLFAPGVGILSADGSSRTARVRLSGTSMATPMVAGALSRLMADNPQADPDLLRRKLLESVVPRRELKGLAATAGVLANAFTASFVPPLASDVQGLTTRSKRAATVAAGGIPGVENSRPGAEGELVGSAAADDIGRQIPGTVICVVKNPAAKARITARLNRFNSTLALEWPRAFGDRLCILRFDPEQEGIQRVQRRLQNLGLFSSVEPDFIVGIASPGSPAPASITPIRLSAPPQIPATTGLASQPGWLNSDAPTPPFGPHVPVLEARPDPLA